MNVAILTEGGKNIGFGHVARCSSIYQAFEQFNISPKLIINGDDSVKSILPNMDVDIKNWIEDLSIISDVDIVIVDSYLANIEVLTEISNCVPLVAYVDDNNRLDYPKGVVINGTLDVSNMNYQKRDDVVYLVGNEFIPLRKDFWDIPKLKINDSIENILITLGGNDLRNLTPKILELLNNNFPKINKKIIIADSFENVSEIEKLKNSNVELIYSPNSAEIIDAMSSVDLAISASGQTLYELACIGVPTVAIGIIDNQKNNILNWKKQGFVEYAGCWNDKNIRYDKRLLGIQAVNGKGSINIAKSILNEYYKNNSVFREVKNDDCLRIFEIANDDDVRESSFNSEKIDLDTHKIWFENILKANSVKFYVLEYKNDLIGQLRLDFDEEFPVISISLNRNYRGLGLSKILLSKGLNLIEGKAIAYIKKENSRSISFFKSMGFKKDREVIIKDSQAFKFIKG